LEIEFLDKKTNIKEYLIKIYDNSNKIIQLLTENINTNKIIPKVIISESVVISKIEINIIKTFDKNPPIHVKISIKGYQNIGCEPTKITTHQSSTKSTSKITTTEIFSPFTSKPEPVTSNKPVFNETTTPIYFTSSSSSSSSNTPSSIPLITTVFQKCLLSEWTSWSTCVSTECGENNVTRTRFVIQGICHDSLIDFKTINNSNCSCSLDAVNFNNLFDNNNENIFIEPDLVIGTTSNGLNVFLNDIISFNSSIFIGNCTQILCDFSGLSLINKSCSSC
jgi:hypothetical protein